MLILQTYGSIERRHTPQQTRPLRGDILDAPQYTHLMHTHYKSTHTVTA